MWYPEGEGPFPLVLIVHGNHLMEEYSDAGYAYLTELFASRGFIAVSVDQNFLNRSTAANLAFISPLRNETGVRGWLLLEHLRQWRTWHTTPGNPFYGKVDLDAIGLIGHSRGGEAAAIAAAFSRLPHHPEDASVSFDYEFAIQAVAAMAPVDGRYLPGGRRVVLEDVNYLVVHGAHDMDVSSFSGARQYARVAFTGDQPYFKAALYIHGANHGQFNSDWGRRDLPGPVMQLFNLRTLMPAVDQEQIAQVTLSAFLEASLRGETGYRALFRDPRTAAAWLPETIYLSQYQGADTLRICTYEEDLDLSTATLPGARLHGEHLTIWREQVVPLKRDTLETSVVYLGWGHGATDGIARYTLTLPELEVALRADSVLCFSLADADEVPVPNAQGLEKERMPIDLTVEVRDGAGNAAGLALSHFSLLQPQLRGRLAKADFMQTLPTSEVVFQTFEFRLGDFAMENPEFNPATLSEVNFVFDGSRRVWSSWMRWV